MGFVNKKNYFLPVVALLLAAFVQVLFVSTVAKAAEIPGAITSITSPDDTVATYEQVRIDIEWAVPDSAVENDTFTMELPAEIFKRDFDDFELRDPSNNLVATASIVGDVVTFTLTDFVNTNVNVSGTAFFTSGLVNVESGQSYSLEFTTNPTTYTVNLDVLDEGIDRSRPYKAGLWGDPELQENSSFVDWRITTPVGPFTTMTLTDEMPEGMTVNCSTLRYFWVTDFDENGQFHSTRRITDPTELDTYVHNVTCTDDLVQLEIGPIDDPASAIDIRFNAIITDDTLSEYRNRAVTTVDGVDQPDAFAVLTRSTQGGTGSGEAGGTTPVQIRYDCDAVETVLVLDNTAGTEDVTYTVDGEEVVIPAGEALEIRRSSLPGGEITVTAPDGSVESYALQCDDSIVLVCTENGLAVRLDNSESSEDRVYIVNGQEVTVAAGEIAEVPLDANEGDMINISITNENGDVILDVGYTVNCGALLANTGSSSVTPQIIASVMLFAGTIVAAYVGLRRSPVFARG